MDITVYLPDEIGSWAKEHGVNLSAMLRAEVEAERKRVQARAKITEDGFERIEVRDEGHSGGPRDVAFKGREILSAGGYGIHDVYVTPKNGIVIYEPSNGDLWIYESYEALAKNLGEDEFLTSAANNHNNPNWPGWSRDFIMSAVASTLGEHYIHELDI